MATKSYKVAPGGKNRGINYDEVLRVLSEIGYPLIQDATLDKNTQGAQAAPGQPYNAFISCKSEDQEYAKIVYDLLESRGLRVFLSKASLPQLGSDEYREQIDLAIENSRHMIVVASSAAHVNAEWVRYEWGLFLGEKLAGRKKGNLLTVLARGMKASELPISLRNREVIPLDPGEIGRLLKYVREGTLDQSGEPQNQ